MRVYTGLDVNSDFAGRFPWTSKFVDQDGVRQAYVDEGPQNSLPTLLCVHGNPTWSFLYREFIRRLSLKYRIIAPDHVGFGRSDKPRDPDYYSIQRHIANLERLLAAAEATSVIPIVHDWGGPIGVGWATRHAENVAGVVILNTSAFVEDPVPNFYRGWKRDRTRNYFVEENYFVETFIADAGTARIMGDFDLDPYRAPFPTVEDRVGVARMPNIWEPDASGRETYPGARATEKGLSRLRTKPALICWGQQDRGFTQRHLSRWRSALADVDGPHLLANASHFVQEDAAPSIIDHIERWLRDRFPAPPR